MKTAVVTGATSGIGFATACALLDAGYRVALVGRTRENCQKAAEALEARSPGAPYAFFHGDLMQQGEVHRVADELLAYLQENAHSALDVLVSNAGGVRAWYATTQEGIEQQFALNHLAGFLLTHRLLGALRRAHGMLLLTSSASHKHCRVRWDDPLYQCRRYSCLGAYKQSKLCNVLFAAGFNRRFGGEGLRAYAVDPGLVSTDIGFKQTGGLVRLVWALRKAQGTPPETAARTYAFLCGAQPRETALYYQDSKPARHDSHADSEAEQTRLFTLSERLCGIPAFGEVLA